MSPSKPHRKLVKHFDACGEIHELTFSCYQRWPILDNKWRHEQLSLSIDRAIENHGWRLTAFVFMPEHVHLLVFPMQQGLKVDKLLFAIKRPFSYRVKQRLAETNDSLLQQLTIQQRPDKTTFRFWQEGPGYDRNIRTEKVLLSAIDYIHLNPVRRGLVEQASDYQWSSAHWYASGGQEVNPLLPHLSILPPDWFTGNAVATN